METGNTDFIYKNELDKACFQHHMTYGKSQDLIWQDKAFRIRSDPEYDGYQRGWMNTMKILKKKTPNLKLVIVPEYQNTKTSLRKDTPKIAQKKFLPLAKSKILFHGLMLLVT